MGLNTKPVREGYLLIDHRASPGVPEDIARRTGFDPKFMGEGKFLESATLKCGHCGGVVVKHPLRVRPRGFCAKCNEHLCDHCDAKCHVPGYVHAGVEAVSDAILELSVKEMSLGSALELLNQPKIFVP